MPVPAVRRWSQPSAAPRERASHLEEPRRRPLPVRRLLRAPLTAEGRPPLCWKGGRRQERLWMRRRATYNDSVNLALEIESERSR
jgi:hypothetical protein